MSYAAAPLLDPKQARYLTPEGWGGSSITVGYENYIGTFLDSAGVTFLVVPKWARRCVVQLAQCSINIDDVDRQEPVCIQRDFEDVPSADAIPRIAVRGVTLNQFQSRELNVTGVDRLLFFAGAEKLTISLEFT